MLFSSFACMEGICDVSCCEELVDDHEDIQWAAVLIPKHSNIVDDNIAEVLGERYLSRRHPEKMFEPVSVFVHFETYNPSIVLVFQPIELLHDSNEVST